jgi:hypothetical protein
MNDTIRTLLTAGEPCTRFNILTRVLGRKANSPDVRKIQRQIADSDRAKSLLSERGEDGSLPHGAYQKWRGAHWVLSVLAEMGYPPGDGSLVPLREQVYACWLSEEHIRNVRVVNGRARRCASQEGNALYATLALGLADDRAERLAENLLKWQWPDGGWNCDKQPSAHKSSFHETLIPLRGLAWYARLTGDRKAKAAAARAAEVFLSRRLFRRLRDGRIIKSSFLKLHYPCYWHYDVLFGLKVLAEAGFIKDPRCKEALDLLESKRLPDGGYPAEGKVYTVSSGRPSTGRSLVAWGPSRSNKANEFVTADALYVLKSAGRLH